MLFSYSIHLSILQFPLPWRLLSNAAETLETYPSTMNAEDILIELDIVPCAVLLAKSKKKVHAKVNGRPTWELALLSVYSTRPPLILIARAANDLYYIACGKA